MDLTEPTSNGAVSTDAASSANEFSGSPAVPATGIRQKFDTAKTKVVDGMHATTDWIKQADIDGIKTGIEQQVRAHPTRTLLIALGVGYVLGRALRRNGV